MDKGKRARVEEEDGSELDAELVQAIEKLQEVQDELERVRWFSFCFFFFLFFFPFPLLLESVYFPFLVIVRSGHFLGAEVGVGSLGEVSGHEVVHRLPEFVRVDFGEKSALLFFCKRIRERWSYSISVSRVV